MSDQKAENDSESLPFKHPRPEVLPGTQDWDPSTELGLRVEGHPAPQSTLGDIGIYTRVRGAKNFPPTVLKQAFDSRALVGIDTSSVRVFRWDTRSHVLTPVWDSGINSEFGFVWSTIRRPGIYAPIGLPRDQLLREVLRVIAYQRRYSDTDDQDELAEISMAVASIFREFPAEELHELRRILAVAEVQMGPAGFADPDLRLGLGGHVAPFDLPRGVTAEDLAEKLAGLELTATGLPEEDLFFPPELGDQGGFRIPDTKPMPNPEDPYPFPFPFPFPWPKKFPQIFFEWPWFRRPIKIIPFCLLFSRNWWMYHHDQEHSGIASGCSSIRSTNVGTMSLMPPTPSLEGTVVSIPSVVNGKIYVGTANIPGTGPGGRLYKIDLYTGAIDGDFPVPRRSPAYFQGVGGSPAVVGGRVYFSGVPGWIFCIDAATLVEIWRVDLRNPDPAHKQPVKNNLGSTYKADSWASPLVVNGKVYVGCGEGEDPSTYGFVYCLDATTGDVIWLFCTTKFDSPGANAAPHNSPNVIPTEVAMSNPLPGWATSAGFSIHPNPVPETGSSVWSSCAYDGTLNRIYVGTGNSKYNTGAPGEGTDLPDEMYGSGLIALDADTGDFKGFFQPAPDDSYRTQDADVDVPGSAMLFTRAGQRVVAFGSKNGSFFLLDADTMNVLGGGSQRRQLLPRAGGSGVPGDRGTPIASVAPVSSPWYENEWGIYATPAVSYSVQKLFVGLGGRGSITDQNKTPFVRALDWNTLADAWPIALDPADNVLKYTTARPPLYGSSEVGLSSPAVVNDVVFVSTNKAALYALRATDGLCLWSAPGLPSYQQTLGPAVYGNWVVIGSGNAVYRYSL